MNETTATPDLAKLEPGTVLVRKDGTPKTATITSKAYDKKIKTKQNGYYADFQEGDKTTNGHIPFEKLDIWMLKPADDASVVAETTPAGDQVPFLTAEDIRLLKEQGKAADIIQAKDDEIAEAHTEVLRLTSRNSELQSRIRELEANGWESNESALIAARQKIEMDAMRDELEKERHLREVAETSVSSLMRKLEARTAPEYALPVAAEPPCKKFKIIRRAQESQMEDLEKEGWQIQHIQFSDAVDYEGHLNIVYYRYAPQPVQPQPTAAVKTVAPDSIINPADELLSHVVADKEEADLIDIHAERAPDLMSLPRFSERWASKFEAAQQHAAQVYRGALRSNPLIASRSVRPMNAPAVRS